MADVLTGATGIPIDNTAVGGVSTSFRQNVVIGGASSSLLVAVGTTAPAGSEIGLYVRQIGSSGVVLGSVAPSSVWSMVLNASSAAVIGSVAPSSAWTVTPSSGLATSTAAIGLTGLQVWSTGDTLVNVGYSTVQASTTLAVPVRLSSGTAQFGVLGPSSGNVIGSVAASSVWSMVLNASSATVIGQVAPSSAWSLGASSAVVIGQVTPSSAWTVTASSGLGASTAAAGLFGLQVWSTGDTLVSVGYSTVQASTTLAVPVRLSSGTAQFGILGPSSGNVVGLVGQSSAWTLASASGTVIGSVAPSSIWTITPTSGALVILSSGIASIGVLGSASATVIGAVSQSSAFALSSGIASIGVLGAASGTVIGSVAPSSAWTVVASTVAPLVIVGQSSDAATDPGTFIIMGGPAATTAIPATVTSLKDQQHMLDNMGRQVMVAYPRQLAYSTFTNLGTTAETIIATAATSWGAGVFLGITSLLISNRSTDTPTEFWMQSSSGGAAVLKASLAANGGAVLNWDPPFSPLNSTQNWTGINTVLNTTIYVTAWVIPTL